MGFVVIIIISILFGVLLYYLDGRKGYNKQFWFIMGFFFSPFTLPFVILGKRKEEHGKETITGEN
jgi:RsiW-degrading membrane proteinase PrsW (M82 family)